MERRDKVNIMEKKKDAIDLMERLRRINVMEKF